MNGRQAKKIRKKSIEFLVQWLKTMLVEEEVKKVSFKNYKKYLPKETHIFAGRTLLVSSYTPRWFGKLIKKKLKTTSIDKITYTDII